MLTVSSSFMTPGRFTVDESDKSYAEENSVMAYHIDETSQIKKENPIEVKNKLPHYLKQNCGNLFTIQEEEVKELPHQPKYGRYEPHLKIPFEI